MTQRNEEWARTRLGLRQTLVVEVIDESVRIPSDLAHEFKDYAREDSQEHRALASGHGVTVTYADMVDIIRDAGFRPIDPITKRMLP